LYGIGDVLAQLLPEFTDLTISKLRFLETEGLVEPRRTASGYRKYSASDVARLRFILAAQRDRYLPLRVIREQLAALDRGERVLGAGPPRVAELPSALLTEAELAERSGLDPEVLAGLVQFGLLAPVASGRFDGDALAVARIASQLVEYGLQPRHLRAYKSGADREVGVIAQVVAPLARRPGENARDGAAQTAAELAALCSQLHAALVRAALRQSLA
jgi:DNA-binding transcriptional MerR regulator